MTFLISYGTNVGKVRRSNEDKYLVFSEEHNLCNDKDQIGSIEIINHTKNSFNIAICVLDGMGGMGNGDVASEILSKKILQTLNGKDSQLTPIELLLDANRHLLNFKQTNPKFGPMGAVGTLAFLKSQEIWIAHVGDTRAYIIQNQKIQQITEDQTYVNALVKSGVISASDARSHPQRNIINNCLGQIEPLNPLNYIWKWNPGDKLLLCSDGLTNELSDKELQAILTQASGIPALEELFRQSLGKSGSDNITLIVAEYRNSATN